MSVFNFTKKLILEVDLYSPKRFGSLAGRSAGPGGPCRAAGYK